MEIQKLEKKNSLEVITKDKIAVTTSKINPASSGSKSWVDKMLEAVNGEAAVNGR